MREDWELKPNGPNWFLIILLGMLFIVGIFILKVDIVDFIDNNINTEPRVEEMPESYCTKEDINNMFYEIYKITNDPSVMTYEIEYYEGYNNGSKIVIITTDINEKEHMTSYRSDCSK